MLHTFVALVSDKPGVLTRVASLFRRLNINIVSLTVGESERADVSRMTIVCEAPDHAAHRIRASLYKLEITVDVDAVGTSQDRWIGHSHAAPRTPLESPYIAGKIGVEVSPPNTYFGNKPGSA